ncbi:MAG: protein kinase [Myxococcota bacterium]
MLKTGLRIQERYEVEALVGQGGLAEVYRVRHVDLGSVHALKLLLFRKKSLADRLLLEGRIQAQLRHPNIVAVTDVVRHDGQYGLLMEYVDNVSLDELIDRRGFLPLDEALTFMAAVMAGVNAAHQAGVLHRDLKPANVLLARTPGGVVPKVADFGIAKVVSEDLEGSTRQGVAMGTPGYMAPEQVLDARSVDARTDVFALGAILYELVSGRRAFADETGEVSVKSTLEGTFLPLSELVEDIPAHVAAAVARALSRDRADRPETVVEFAAQLLPEHPELLIQVTGPGTSVPISVDPSAPSSFSLPGTSGGGPGGQGPTIAPLPTSMTFDGGRVAESLSEPPPDTAEDAEPEERRAGLALWAMVGTGMALLLLLCGIGLYGNSQGWFEAPVAVDGTPNDDQADAGSAAAEAQGSTAEDAGDPKNPKDEAAQAGDDPERTSAVVASQGAGRMVVDGGVGTAADTPTPSGTAADVGSDPTGDDASTADASTADGSDPEPTDGDPTDALADPDAQTPGDGTGDGSTGAADPGDGSADGSTAAADPADGTASTPDEPTGSSEPEVSKPVEVMPMAAFLETSWDGRVFKKPFTLRISRAKGGDVWADGRFVLGGSQRNVALNGRFDPMTGALYLKEINGDLVLRGTASPGSIVGSYWRDGRGDKEAFTLTRR